MSTKGQIGETSSISYSMGFTKGLPGYSSLRLDVGETVALKPGEDSEKAFKQLVDRVDNRLGDTLKKAEERIG